MTNALVIAGGGQYGVGPARLLGLMRTGGLLPKIDFACGTSVGALLVTMLAVGTEPGNVLYTWLKHVAKIFGSKTVLGRAGFGPAYDDAYVNGLLKQVCGDRLVGDTVFPVNIFAWNASTRNLKVWDANDKYPLWKAARSSMAAPTYFSQVDDFFWDGGMAANDPAVHCIAAAAKRFGCDPKMLKMLNLVTTGRSPKTGVVGSNAHSLTLLKKVVLPALTAGNAADQKFICEALMGNGRYLHVQPDCKDYGMDTVPQLEISNVWAKWHKDNIGMIKEWSEA